MPVQRIFVTWAVSDRGDCKGAALSPISQSDPLDDTERVNFEANSVELGYVLPSLRWVGA
jgi:hypothetical protein